MTGPPSAPPPDPTDADGLPDPAWIPPSLAPYTCGRPEATVRDWMRRGLLRARWDYGREQWTVNAAELADLAETRPERPGARCRPARPFYDARHKIV